MKLAGIDVFKCNRCGGYPLLQVILDKEVAKVETSCGECGKSGPTIKEIVGPAVNTIDVNRLARESAIAWNTANRAKPIPPEEEPFPIKSIDK